MAAGDVVCSLTKIKSYQCGLYNGVDNSSVVLKQLITKYPMTLAGWCNLNSDNANNGVIIGMAEDGVDGDRCALYINTAELPNLHHRKGADTSGSIAATTNLTENKWHHIAGVWETVNSRKIYVDGVLEATDTNVVAFSTCTNITIGYYKTNVPTSWMDGHIRECVMYNKALSQTEITELASGTRPKTAKDRLVGHWRLNTDSTDEIDGNDMTDANVSFINKEESVAIQVDSQRVAATDTWLIAGGKHGQVLITNIEEA